MTIGFIDKSLSSGAEPTELLKPLAFEYLAELNRMGLAEFIESVGMDGFPVLIVIIPHAKVMDGKIVEITELVGKEKEVANSEGEQDENR